MHSMACGNCQECYSVITGKNSLIIYGCEYLGGDHIENHFHVTKGCTQKELGELSHALIHSFVRT